MKKHLIEIVALTLLAVAGCTSHEVDVDALLRSKVDALNKASFKARFDDARLSERYARRALAYVDDSLPNYHDGRLRAWNNIANAYLSRAVHDSVYIYADSVLDYAAKSPNREVERALASLLKARTLQRHCDIAASYQLLYDIEHSRLLDGSEDGLLYNLARSEFYITTTTLNYHYRNKSQYQQAELLTEMEQQRHRLRCDYGEDMSFNYAIAYGYYALCEDSIHQAQYLAKALDYCFDNFRILNDKGRYNTYHLGNTYQLLGFMLWSPHINQNSWDHNANRLNEICRYVGDAFGFDVTDSALTVGQDSRPSRLSTVQSLAFPFLSEATSLFFLHDDPYQRLGAVVSTGRYCMAHGDTATARLYFNEALIDTTMLGVAPKFEAMLYEGFLTSGCASNNNDVLQWTRKEIELLNYIKQNEKADFILQQELNRVRSNNGRFLILAACLLALALALLLTLLLLHRRTKALQRETARLQATKQQDVERIANVETCLSVLRHDITPFISYLQNDHLPDELKREVTGQLIRTFENIKNWTNLSIPSGLQFRCSTVSLQQVFDSVASSVNNFRGSDLAITFLPTSINVRADRQLLEILLRNLVNNAIQHTTHGTVNISAQTFSEDPRFACVSVSDTGSGMTDDQLENLFRTDRPIASHNSPNGYGTGFGLILCRYIIKKHDDNTLRGCRIWAQSTLGEGSQFHFLVQREEGC